MGAGGVAGIGAGSLYFKALPDHSPHSSSTGRASNALFDFSFASGISRLPPGLGGTILMFGRLVYLLTSYDGRIRRRTFWLSLPIVALISLSVLFIGGLLDFLLYRQLGELAPQLFGIYPATVVAVVLSWYFQLALIVKRLHDRNKRALWLWLAQVPIIGTIWLIVEAGFMRGTSGPNDWGDDPRSRSSAVEAPTA